MKIKELLHTSLVTSASLALETPRENSLIQTNRKHSDRWSQAELKLTVARESKTNLMSSKENVNNVKLITKT